MSSATNAWHSGRYYTSCGFPTTGSYAEYIDVPAAGLLVPLPDNVSYTQGCQLFVNPLTADGFLNTCAKDGLKEGDFVVFTAAASAVAKMAMELIRDRKLGYKPVAVVRRPEQKQELEALGAICIATNAESVAERLA